MEKSASSKVKESEKRISINACNILNELRQAEQLCDAVIRVEDARFPVHRAIMSACSPYFRALFTNGLCETEMKEIFVPGFTREVMENIIEFAYTREAKVSGENVERLLPAADYFHVMGLLKSCCKFLEDNLDAENCIGIRSFARTYFCQGLAQTSHKYLLAHFPQVAVKSNEVLMLNVSEIAELLGDDDLNVKNEEIVFDGAIRWIQHDPDTRKKCMADLLKCVRLGLLNTQVFIEKIKSHPYVKENDECKPIVIDALKLLYDLDVSEAREVDLTNPLSRPRVPYEILFAVGGWSGGSPTSMIEIYDTRADRWNICTDCDTGPRAYHGCATVLSKIYVVGGFDGMDYFNSCRCFDPATQEWNEVAPMNARRCYVSVAVLDNCVYAMGGFDGHIRQNTAERYRPSTNQWSFIAPMHHQRSDASATTLNDKIYIAGGFNGQECLQSSEYYDPNVNQWTMINPMRNRRSGVGVVAHDGMLYAVGGFNGITRLNNGEKYNPVNNSWKSMPEMFSPRSNYAIEVLDDMVFTIGGFNGVTTIYNVECYDPKTDEWYDCTDMNIYRSALSACTVKGLPNVRDYINREKGKSEEKKT